MPERDAFTGTAFRESTQEAAARLSGNFFPRAACGFGGRLIRIPSLVAIRASEICHGPLLPEQTPSPAPQSRKYFVMATKDMTMQMIKGLSLFLATLAGAVIGWTTSLPAHAADKVTVFAAASLKNALDEVVSDYQAKSGNDVAISYASSSSLANQILAGAPADIFLSADLDWMDYVEKNNGLKTGTRENLLGNSLVLIASSDSRTSVMRLSPDVPLAKMLGDGRLAIGEATSVPAGKYAKAALESLGLWESVKGKLAQAGNVRAALAFVARGEAPLGIVYATDAMSEPHVRVIGTFPADSYPAIVYPVAITAEAKSKSASGLIAYLRYPQSHDVFEKYGFSVLDCPGDCKTPK
jgi:molybdate transport system substrate-binding protein